MFKSIMIPVDLGHADKLEHALKVAADLALHYNAAVTYVGVTSPQPSSVAHSPEEFATKLAEFTRNKARDHGLPVATAHHIVTHDPAVDLDRALAEAADDLEADLVVMASHMPRHFDFPSHGGKLASHARASVLLVRGDV